MKAIMILLGQKTDWKEIKLYIGDVNSFLDKLKNFDVESVKDRTWDKVRKDYINKPDF